MKKINEGLYEYKKIRVTLDLNGNYVAKVYVKDLILPMTICGATQKSFKDNFNRLVFEHGGIDWRKM